jgi:hypothetical protein
MIDVFHTYAIEAAKFYFSTENFVIRQKKAMFVFWERIQGFRIRSKRGVSLGLSPSSVSNAG